MSWTLSRRLPAIILAVYWIALFIGTHMQLPSRPGSVASNDKLLHFTAYLGLAVLLLWTIAPQRRPVFVSLLAIAIIGTYGLIDELLQIPIPKRHGDALDLVADVAGCVVGVIAYWLGAQLLAQFSRAPSGSN